MIIMPLSGFTKRIYVLFVLFLLLFNVSAQNTNTRPELGLVLSGGGAKGLAHIGVLKVLEESGIQVDMIGGTSMGSIVGGLYAMGYSASEIETMALNQNWTHLLTDKIHRNKLSVDEKKEFDKFIVNFPFEDLSLKLPAGLGAGQNVSMLLSNYAVPISDINDFNELPIPFLCIGTDIVNGKEVVLRKGYLPDAIRASMAIPTIFTPVKINSNLLVDGGLVNNFPADRVKEMGAEYIIGVNLGLKDYTEKDLNNLAAVLEQSIFFHAKERNKNNQKLCNILISPNVYKSNASSFANAAELIAIGENAAREILPQLKHIADSLNGLGNAYPRNTATRMNSLFVEEVEYQGLEQVSPRFLQGRLRLKFPAQITVSEIEEAIERAYGSMFFDKITFKVHHLGNNKIKLIIVAEEAKADLLRLGVRYDDQFRTQLLLNSTFRNKLVKGSKLSLDIQLGEYPRFTGEYKIHTAWKPKKKPLFNIDNIGLLPDFGLRVDARSFDVYNYENGKRLGTYNFRYVTSTLFASSNISNSLYLEGGASVYASNLNTIVSQENFEFHNQYFVLNGELKVDSRNKKTFYNKGTYMGAVFESYSDLHLNTYAYTPFQRTIIHAETAIPFGKSLALIPQIYTGWNVGDSIPVETRFYLGGARYTRSDNLGIVPFNGLRFMEESGNTAIVAGLILQYEFFKKHFITASGNIGQAERYWIDLFNDVTSLLSGYGVKYSYNSIVGPVEFGVSKTGHNSNSWISSINIGLYF